MDESQPMVIVPCGRRKVWDKHHDQGATAARDVYTGPAFRQDRRYAERFAPSSWMILSAKYGLISPDFVIPGSYDVTFTDPHTTPVSIEVLRDQIRDQHLDRLGLVVALGSKAYRDIISAAFMPFGTTIVTPFAGLGIGRYLQAVKRAALSGKPPSMPGSAER